MKPSRPGYSGIVKPPRKAPAAVEDQDRPHAAPRPLGQDQGDLYRLLVESVRDYAIFALDPDGYILSWNAGAQRFKGYTADEVHRAALLDLLSARAGRRGVSRVRAAHRRATRALRGRGLAHPQRRIAILGERRDHRAAQRTRRADRVRQGHPRSHRATRSRRGAARERGALPPHRRRRARLRHLHARPERQRRDMERGRRAHQGVPREGDHRLAISPSSIRRPTSRRASPSASWRSRRRSESTRRTVGEFERTAQRFWAQRVDHARCAIARAS